MKRLPALALALLAPAACAEPEPACPEGELLDARTEVCVPAACGTGDWGPDGADADAAHVAPWGRGDGAGSAEDPLDSLEAALAASDRVVLAAGTYEAPGRVDLGGTASIRGRCRELVVLDGSAADEAALHLEDGELTLRDLTVADAPAGGLRAEPGGLADTPLLRLRRVDVRGCGGVGVSVATDNGTIEAEDLRILDLAAGEDGVRGVGFRMDRGTLRATDLHIENAGEAGLLAFVGEVEVDGLVVRNVQTRADGLRGRGVSIREGARAALRDVLVEDVREAAVTVSSGSTATVSGLRVRRVSGVDSGAAGFGVAVITGGEATVEDADVEATVAPAFAVQAEGSVLTVRESAVRACKGGLQADSGGLLVVEGVLVEDTERWGLSLLSARAEVLDLSILRTIAGQAELEATGVALMGSTLSARGLLVQDTARLGLSLLDGSRAELADCEIRGSFQGGEEVPAGIVVQEASELIATDLVVAGNAGVGLYVRGASAELTGGSIRDTSWLDGDFGRGVTVGGGASFTATGLGIHDNHDVGLLVTGAGSVASFTDGEVTGTRSAAVRRSGAGLAVQDGAVLAVYGGRVAGNAGPGLSVLRGVGTSEGTTYEDNGFAGATCAAGRLEVSGGSITASRPDAASGGGVGMYARAELAPCTLVASGVSFSELPGAAVYLRGPGDYRVVGCEVRACGTPPSLAGGVVALEGVRAPEGGEPGLVLEDNLFASLPGDAVLLDGSGALLASGNRFEDLGGEPLYRQRCGPETYVLDGSGADPGCRDAPRPLGPPLLYRVALAEGEPVE